MALFKTKNLGISFGGLRAVDSFQTSIEEGQLYGPIGSNRAGRTTTSNLLAGVHKPNTGNTELVGVNITGKRTTETNQVGIARTFQNIRLFKDLSVLDNVRAGLHNYYRYSTTAGIFRLPNYFKVGKQMNERAIELLEVSGLDKECDCKASGLPYGKQRRLEIARALAAEPKFLLLDESAAGINSNKTAELMNAIRFVRDNLDMAISLIEHDMELVSGICEELTVPNFGQVLCQGEAGVMLHNPEVVKAYLGRQEERIIWLCLKPGIWEYTTV